jgi:hypothetical protein
VWTTGLAYGGNVTYAGGGYVKVGRLVIVSLSFHVKADVSINEYIDVVSGLPYPLVNSALSVWTFNTSSANTNKTRIIDQNGTGIIYSYGELKANESLQIAGTYLSLN